jgi:hypothetical protein
LPGYQYGGNVVTTDEGAEMTPTPTIGEQLDAIMQRMDAAYADWRAAGRPAVGPTVDAKDAVYADLRDLNERIKNR